jgi:polyphosphate kinase 2 (PPK2 family)
MAKMKQKKFEKELARLQARLCELQERVKEKRLRVIVIFEGRDAAGKGGTIKAITERVSPRVFRLTRCRRRRTARRARCTCSATCSTSRPPAKS